MICSKMTLEGVLRNRNVLHKLRRSASTHFLTRYTPSTQKAGNWRLKFNPSSNSVVRCSRLTSAQALCSVPASSHLFESKVSFPNQAETEICSVDSHLPLESTAKTVLAGLHSSSTSNSEDSSHYFIENNIETYGPSRYDSFMLKFSQYSPFLISSTSSDAFEVGLAKCADVAEVFEILKANVESLNTRKAGMTITRLWQIVSSSNNLLDLQSPYFSVTVTKQPGVKKLLQLVENNFPDLTDDEVSSLMVYLHCLGLSSSHLIHKMLYHFMPRIDALNLKVLARILYFLRSPDVNHTVKGKFMPTLVKCLNECNSMDDFLLIDHCVLASRKLLPTSYSELERQKLLELLDANIGTEDASFLIRCLQSILEADYNSESEKLQERICSMLVSKVPDMNMHQLIRLRSCCAHHKLNRHLLNNVFIKAAEAIEEIKDPVDKARLFLALSTEKAQALQPSMVAIGRNILRSQSADQHLTSVVYPLFRVRAVDDFKLLDEFWDKVLAGLEDSMSRRKHSKQNAFGRETAISLVLLRYLHFNFNLGGQYRHKCLEARLLELLQEELNGVAGIMISRLVRMSSFVLAYSDPTTLPGALVGRLLEAAPQYGFSDVTLLTHALQISQNFNGSCYYEKYAGKLLSLAHMLSRCLQRIAAESNSLAELTSLNKSSIVIDQIFLKYGQKYSTSTRSSNSRWTQGLPHPAFHTTSSVPLSHKSVPNLRLPTETSAALSSSLSLFECLTSSALSALDHCDKSEHESSQLGRVSSANDTQESLLQARVAPLVMRHMHQINSKTASAISLLYGRTRFYSVQVLDNLLEYLHRNQGHIHGLTVAQALHSAYRLGHAPSLSLGHLRDLGAVIAQDLRAIHGLPLMGSVMALSFYQSLPIVLIEKIFNVDFMDFLDKEMTNSFSKRQYSLLVRNQLMELNRSVCIGHPETRVPWFHEEHCRDIIQTARHKKDGFFSEVCKSLVQVLGSKSHFSEHTYSPYYYLMDFSFVLDDKGQAVMQPGEPSVLQPRMAEVLRPLPPGYTRHCILLTNVLGFTKRHTVNDAGTAWVEPQLKGHLQLKRRHLEVLGYDVINIARHDWQTMALGTAARKEAYLREIIYNSRS